MELGNVFDIQKNSFVDGPGIRTTVFLKGCNLRCKWCHNPESWVQHTQMMFHKSKCRECGACKNICEEGAIREDFTIDQSKCMACGKCEQVCFYQAKKLCGYKISTDDVMKKVRKDKLFYDSTGGGVTFSGGECMLQIAFLEEMLKKCKDEGIHTAIDTAGNIPWANIERVLPYVDLFLYDVKCISDDRHKKVTGVSNRLILDNLKKILEQFPEKILIRIPVIQDVNIDEQEICRIAEFLEPYKEVKVELLPYHGLGEHKRDALEMEEYTAISPEEDLMLRYKACLEG